ncbi:hypothetical protein CAUPRSCDRAFT_11797 [Caulochytrium protostelioides]|uniref:Trimethylguanosine synthase n=1 Tax=Caulochytrium protostelioides TaxID=1555241 RepID=A0A4P9WYC6_9FUNG|nr:hypothetical protein CAUPRSCDRAFT_11797 [Caulochytrium protostelioides]
MARQSQAPPGHASPAGAAGPSPGILVAMTQRARNQGPASAGSAGSGSSFSAASSSSAAVPVTVPPGTVVVDLFGGIGGNAIALARRGFRVVTVELTPSRCDLIQHNCLVYGVADQVTVVQGDVVALLDEHDVDIDIDTDDQNLDENDTTVDEHHNDSIPARKRRRGMASASDDGRTRLARRLGLDAPPFVFMSPPWGGPEYIRASEFPLDDGLALCDSATHAVRLSGTALLHRVAQQSSGMAVFLPRTTPTDDLVALGIGPCLIERVAINGRVKGITASWISTLTPMRLVAESIVDDAVVDAEFPGAPHHDASDVSDTALTGLVLPPSASASVPASPHATSVAPSPSPSTTPDRRRAKRKQSEIETADMYD